MRLKIFFLCFAFITFSVFSTDKSFAEKICKAYKDDSSRQKCFDELNPTYKATENKLHYMKFKYGGTACPKLEYWKDVIDRLQSNSKSPFVIADQYCIAIRENSFVYGILEATFYKGVELAKIKASNEKTYWIELPAHKPIIEKQTKKPVFWRTDLRTQDSKRIY